jgi:hypothetical protein
MTGMDFDAVEKAAVVAVWRTLTAEPPPANPRPYGCLTFLVAAALLVLLPQLPKWFGWALPQPFGQILFVILVIALVGGFFVGVFVGSGVYGRARYRASESLEWLASHPGLIDVALRRKHAVSLIANAVVSDGPTTVGTVDIAEAKVKLGTNLQYVVAVERVLVAENLTGVHFGDA